MARENPLQSGFKSHSHKWPTFAFTSESGYTLGFRRKIAHSGPHAETGTFRTGLLSLPSERFARFGNPARPGVRTANFAAFRSWSRVLPKNAESLWDSDALMRVAVPRRRGPAGLLRCCIPRRIDHLRGLSPPHRCAEKELPSASRVGLSHQPCLHPASRSGFV